MQAAHRLSKNKAELKTLRQEKEEVERLKKEKLSLEENTKKNLIEMDGALFKASGQVERANAIVHRLEVENAALSHEIEAAKLHAAESAASCQEVSKREKKTLMKVQSWEKQKTFLQGELMIEKCEVAQLLQKLQQAKVLQQLEKEVGIPFISEVVTDFRDFSGTGSVKRECVMCLSDEMSMVFIPCAHQVVCTTCNELYEKQGMKDCPCMSLIQLHILVRFTRS
ncbi:hypothetical protein REPUB_Repub15cG0031300 [Reevesia pubescens]